jgi:hypothetical protein
MMASLPNEILTNIFSFLQLNDKHVMRRVSSHWKEGAEIAITDQKQLVIHPDDSLNDGM